MATMQVAKGEGGDKGERGGPRQTKCIWHSVAAAKYRNWYFCLATNSVSS